MNVIEMYFILSLVLIIINMYFGEFEKSNKI